MTQAIHLAERIDRVGARTLASEIMALRSADLVIDAAAVSQLGTPAIQVLMAAVQQWAADGNTIRVANASDAVRSAVEKLRIPADALALEAAA